MMMGATLMLTWWWQAIALIYPASKKQRCRKSGTLLLRYLGAVSSSHHYWRVSLRSFTPTEAGAVAAFYALFVATVFTVK